MRVISQARLDLTYAVIELDITATTNLHTPAGSLSNGYVHNTM